MTISIPPSTRSLPHHKLIAYQRALEFLLAVKAASIKDAKLRDEATRAAKGACLNIAEGAARFSAADKARVYAIARGEVSEAAAAVEIAAAAGEVKPRSAASRSRSMSSRFSPRSSAADCPRGRRAAHRAAAFAQRMRARSCSSVGVILQK